MKIKRILSIILLFIFLLPTFGCQAKQYDALRISKYFENDGIFVYNKITDGKSINYGKYELCGQVNLTLSDKVYIPPFYKGKEVISFCTSFSSSIIATTGIVPLFNNVDSLYLPYTMSSSFSSSMLAFVENVDDNFKLMPQIGPKKLFFVKNKEDYKNLVEKYKTYYTGLEEIYLSNHYFKELGRDDVCINFITSCGEYNIIRANTTYYFNYENNPNNGIFFINDFERGGKIENTPYEPLREGYKFAGWYKEPECINAWDFENDTLPMPEYYENGELKFVETKLYAKWI